MTSGEARPRRWLVVGSGGAGKSTLARRMGRILGLPVVHLDRHYWKPGWVETPPDPWRRTVAELSAADEWIMDGNYGGSLDVRLARAHAVVFLDLPPWRCLWRVVARRIASRRTGRADLPDGVDDRLDWGFVRWILGYPRGGRVRLLRALDAAPGVRVHRLRTPAEVRRFEERLGRG